MNIRQLNTRLEREQASWRAKSSPVARLSVAKFKVLLGHHATSFTSAPIWEAQRAQHFHLRSGSWSPSDQAFQEVDWRNRDGKNYVTPPKDQGSCGSCDAFAIAGLVESMALIEQGVFLDLSEGDLFFNGSHAADCSVGWEQTAALTDVKMRGIVQERDIPYTLPPVLTPLSNHAALAVKVTDFSNVVDVQTRKSYLSYVGPMVAGITMLDEFASLGTGVFRPTSNAKVVPGGHLILIIGYSDIDGCWIVKNSWGASWGDHGFGRIGYGTMDIDTVTGTVKTYFTSCEGVKIPPEVRASTFATSFGLTELVGSAGAGTTQRIDGFYSADDGMRHAITVDTNGQIFEAFYNSKQPVGRTLIATQVGAVDIGSFWTDDDKCRHVLVADAAGGIEEVYFSPSTGVSATRLGNLNMPTRICGFYTPDDGLRHAIVATADGRVHEIFFGKSGSGSAAIGQFNKVVDIGGFFSSDDGYRHVIVASADGTISEIYFNPSKGTSQTVVAKVENVAGLSAFFVPNDPHYSRRVLLLQNVLGKAVGGDLPTSTFAIIELRWSSQNALSKKVITNVTNALDLGGFHSTDDGFAHGVVLLKSGVVKELFYRAVT